MAGRQDNNNKPTPPPHHTTISLSLLLSSLFSSLSSTHTTILLSLLLQHHTTNINSPSPPLPPPRFHSPFLCIYPLASFPIFPPKIFLIPIYHAPSILILVPGFHLLWFLVPGFFASLFLAFCMFHVKHWCKMQGNLHSQRGNLWYNGVMVIRRKKALSTDRDKQTRTQRRGRCAST